MKLVLACTKDGGIGYKNRLPWDNIRGDLQRFKKLTQDSIVVMGRNTWESLPKRPLPNRLNLVVTSNELPENSGAIAIKNVSCVEHHPNCWLIGGSQLISTSWDKITEVHLTVTHDQYDCDCFIDLLFLQQNFKCIHMTKHIDHEYQVWERMSEAVPRLT